MLEQEATAPLSTTFTLACHLQGTDPPRKTDWIRSGSVINNNHRVNIVRAGAWNNLTITNITRSAGEEARVKSVDILTSGMMAESTLA